MIYFILQSINKSQYVVEMLTLLLWESFLPVSLLWLSPEHPSELGPVMQPHRMFFTLDEPSSEQLTQPMMKSKRQINGLVRGFSP